MLRFRILDKLSGRKGLVSFMTWNWQEGINLVRKSDLNMNIKNTLEVYSACRFPVFELIVGAATL